MKARSRGFYYGLLACTVAVLAALSAVVLWYAFPYWVDEMRPGGQVTLGLVSSIFEYVIILVFTTVLSSLILARIRQQRHAREAEEERRRSEAARSAEIAGIEAELRQRFAAVALLADVAQTVNTMNRATRYVLDGLRYATRDGTEGTAAEAMTLGDAAHILDAYYAWQGDLGRLEMAAGALRVLLPRLRQRGHALGMPEEAFAQADGLLLRLDGLTRISGAAAGVMHRAVHDVLDSAARADKALRIMDCYRVTELLFARTIALIAYLEQGAAAAGLADTRSFGSLVTLKEAVSGIAAVLSADERAFRAKVDRRVAAA